MICIHKVIDSFEILCDRGQILAADTHNLLQVLEKELDINIFDRDWEMAVEALEDRIDSAEDTIAALKTELKNVKEKAKEKDKS